MTEPRHELVRSTLGVAFLGVLVVAALWVLQPFIAPTIWATMIVVSTWPLMRWVEARLWGRRSLAVLVMTLLLLLLLVLPLVLAIGTLAAYSAQIAAQAAALAHYSLPPAPEWLKSLPLVGDHLAQLWAQTAQAGAQGLLAKLEPYANAIASWLVSHAGSVGSMFVQFALILALSAVMYAGGEAGAQALRRFARRLAGAQGEGVVALGGQAIRGVALGVGVTAVVQALLGGLGLALAGVPFATLLTALMFVLGIAQIGATPVVFLAAVATFWNGDTGWGIFLGVWSVVVGTLDSVLRPYLIRKGADLPLLLIFAGVVGGLLAFGLVGIFVGPVVLAVAYTLLVAWVDSGEA